MGRAISNELFRLIRQLKPSEKRYFKRYAGPGHSHGESIYVKLFDAISKQADYDEKKILQMNFVKQQHLPMLKNYLYALIMESLRLSRLRPGNIDKRLNAMLGNLYILREKKLEEEEARLLQKIKLLALKYERWGVAMEAFFAESHRLSRKTNLNDERIKIFTEVKNLFDKMENLLHYQKLGHSLTALNNSRGFLQRTTRENVLKTIEKDPLMRNEKNALSVQARINYYRNQYLTRIMQNDYSGSYRSLIPYMNLLETYRSDYEEDYLSMHYDYAYVEYMLGKNSEALATMKKARGIVNQMTTVTDTILYRHYMSETHFCIELARFEEGISIIKDIEKKIESVATGNRFYKLLNFNMVYLYFGNGNYKAALRWANHFINQSGGPVYEDLQGWLRIMLLIIYYELNNMDILPHQIVSTYRFLSKRERLFKTEQSILNFIRDLTKADIEKGILNRKFKDFHSELKRIPKESKEKKAVSFYFDIISWLESKIENRSFAEVMREKAGFKISPAGIIEGYI